MIICQGLPFAIAGCLSTLLSLNLNVSLYSTTSYHCIPRITREVGQHRYALRRYVIVSIILMFTVICLLNNTHTEGAVTPFPTLDVMTTLVLCRATFVVPRAENHV